MKYVLSIDGGGIRGILPAALLQSIEEQVRPVKDIFHLISGTSTGGILAAGLALGISPKTLGSLYSDHGQEIFGSPSITVFGPKYSPVALEARLKTVLGVSELSDISSPELLIPSYCIQLPKPIDSDNDGVPEGAMSWFFKSWVARTDLTYNWPLWQVARATSAAPSYFPPASIDRGYWMVDGGVFANNPAMCALVAAKQLWPGEDISLLSLGTGTKITALDGPRSQGWGLISWASNIFPIFMDGSADVVTYQCRELLGDKYLRCDTALTGVDEAFDNASVSNILNLKTLASAFVAKNLPHILSFLN